MRAGYRCAAMRGAWPDSVALAQSGRRVATPAPLALAPSFYRFIEGLARRRGLDPDAPPHLRKVTATL